jgi:low temperature requirement protein LtrA
VPLTPSRWTTLISPPRLQSDTERTATRLELFFDLAFVLAVQQSADRLGGDVSWHGAGIAAGLITVVWWAWASSTLYANRFDTDDVVYRLSKLSAMAAVVVLAAAAPAATGPGAWRFALGYAVLRLILVLQYLRAWRHVPNARPAIRAYLYSHSASALLWLLSIPVPGPARYWLWGAGVALEFAATPIAGKISGTDAPLHLEHLPERFALFVILVLGESVAAVVAGLQGADWHQLSVAIAVPAFVIAVTLWWTYFDLSGAAAKRRLQVEGGHSRVSVHDRYLFAHLPLAGGLVAVAVGLEHAITEAKDGMTTTGTTWTLAGGLVLYLAATWALQALADRPRNGLLWPGSAIVAVLMIAALTSGLTMLLLLAAILVAGVIVGLGRRETGSLPTAEV